jgi:hypothetical protein
VNPGGNLTGFPLEVTPETNAKMLQLLHEAAPDITRIGALWNSANPGSRFYLDAVSQSNSCYSPQCMYAQLACLEPSCHTRSQVAVQRRADIVAA